METFDEFRARILKIDLPRVHLVTNSIKTLTMYNKLPKNLRDLMDMKTFRKVLRRFNYLIGEEVLKGNTIYLPMKMGTLRLLKHKPVLKYVDGKVINEMSYSWIDTLKVWYEDEEFLKSKKLIRKLTEYIYKICYNTAKANYKNKYFFLLHVSRTLKNRLKEAIRNGTAEAMEFFKTDIK